MVFEKEMLKKSLFLNVQKFTYDRALYLIKNGLKVNDETRQQIWDDYEITIKEVIQHLRRLFPAGFLHLEGTFDFSLDGLTEEAKVFLQTPSIDCVIKPLGDDSEALMSFENGYLVEAYDLEVLPNLPNKYRTPKFNGILEGRHITDIKRLLDSYEVLPENNMIDVAIEEYAMRRMEKKDFVDAVIESLLLSGTEEDLTRAYLFDHFMGAQFDFEAYKRKGRTK